MGCTLWQNANLLTNNVGTNLVCFLKAFTGFGWFLDLCFLCTTWYQLKHGFAVIQQVKCTQFNTTPQVTCKQHEVCPLRAYPGVLWTPDMSYAENGTLLFFQLTLQYFSFKKNIMYRLLYYIIIFHTCLHTRMIPLGKQVFRKTKTKERELLIISSILTKSHQNFHTHQHQLLFLSCVSVSHWTWSSSFLNHCFPSIYICLKLESSVMYVFFLVLKILKSVLRKTGSVA